MILTCLPNTSWNLLNNCLFYLFLLCFGQTTGPFSADAASTGVQNQVVCCHSTVLLLCLKHPSCPPRLYTRTEQLRAGTHVHGYPWYLEVRVTDDMGRLEKHQGT